MSPFRRFALSLAATVATAAAARADLVTTFEGTIPSVDVSMTANGVNLPGNPVGPFVFTVQPGSTDPTFAPNSTLRTFCADLFQGVSPATTYTFTPVPVDSLPDVGTDPTRLGLIQRLFDRHYETATDATNGGAFQLALWELLYDGPGNLNLGSGNVVVTSPDTLPAVAVAKSWLAALETPDPSDAVKYQLVGLFHPTAQDQLAVVPNPIPAPAGVVLGLIAVGGFAARRLRRKAA